ncbi:MAG: hypothetical protein HYZ48_04905 [Chlamydiales bacterium]|nr:hypothetical protein [Chlamydiales bacterium]
MGASGIERGQNSPYFLEIIQEGSEKKGSKGSLERQKSMGKAELVKSGSIVRRKSMERLYILQKRGSTEVLEERTSVEKRTSLIYRAYHYLFKASPRDEEIKMTVGCSEQEKAIAATLDPKYPSWFFHILYHFQSREVALLPLGGISVFIASLEKSNKLGIFLLAIHSLMEEGRGNNDEEGGNDFLLKLGVELIQQPYMRKYAADPSYKGIIDKILEAADFRALKELQSPLSLARVLIQNITSEETTSEAFAKKGLDLIGGLSKEELPSENKIKKEFKYQMAFLFKMNSLLLKEKDPIDFSQREALFQISLQLLSSPDIFPAFQIMKIRKVSEKIIKQSVEEFNTEWMRAFADAAYTVMDTSSISFSRVCFLLFWIQNEFLYRKEAIDLVAGIREWDPSGETAQFALHRLTEMIEHKQMKEVSFVRLLHFILFWKGAPANKDLIGKWEFTRYWNKAKMQILSNTTLLDSIDPIIRWVVQDSVDNFSQDYIFHLPLSLPRIFVCKITKPRLIWFSSSIQEDLYKTTLFYLLEALEKIEVEHLVNRKERPAALLEHGKRFNQIPQFFASQILAARTIEEARKIVQVICCVEQKLLEVHAYDPAFSIHSILSFPATSRLSDAFKKEWYNPSASLFCLERGAAELRELQKENRWKCLPLMALLLKDLTFLGEGKKEGIQQNGQVDVEILRDFGCNFNEFNLMKGGLAQNWSHIQPDAMLLSYFQAFPDSLDDEIQEDIWWKRSQKIHQPQTNIYWGVEVE